MDKQKILDAVAKIEAAIVEIKEELAKE